MVFPELLERFLQFTASFYFISLDVRVYLLQLISLRIHGLDGLQQILVLRMDHLVDQLDFGAKTHDLVERGAEESLNQRFLREVC